ncbi:MAG: response regulator [Nitrospiraceae bacterium]|nr:response regulator [Nitrospiraceae bacterium]
MKILVVDDEQLVRWFMDRALRKGGHEVITASNITEASERLQSEEIDLLFIDLRMPEGNGTELIKKVVNLPNRPKVIVCSAFITSELEEEFREKGICILKKPFKLDELNYALKNCLGG